MGRASTPSNPSRANGAPADSTRVTAATGVYEFSPGFELTVRTQDGQLEISVGGPFSPVYAESEDEFFHHRTYSTYRFERDADGNGTRVIMDFRGQVFDGGRKDAWAR